MKFHLFDDFGSFQSQLWHGGIPILNFWQNPVKKKKKILEGFWILANCQFFSGSNPKFWFSLAKPQAKSIQKPWHAMATQLSWPPLARPPAPAAAAPVPRRAAAPRRCCWAAAAAAPLRRWQAGASGAEAVEGQVEQRFLWWYQQ